MLFMFVEESKETSLIIIRLSIYILCVFHVYFNSIAKCLEDFLPYTEKDVMDEVLFFRDVLSWSLLECYTPDSKLFFLSYCYLSLCFHSCIHSVVDTGIEALPKEKGKCQEFSTSWIQH